ncbi:HigA family addiction module antitoxin [Roseibium aggregatum]|uniref:HigA family addiction module antitoxin n=1 Tax=Roseibium aggregatum TaxID=187304 RepID=UPI001A8CDA7D|nr:HigA family addiction module antitoxin [Roseibium aggregatum]MBN8180069.1 HigA family addiction module antidote protein [Roseibium aggregatum]UES45768.1 HigA family addiction module antidote protein [Roseibium aggregatum]
MSVKVPAFHPGEILKDLYLEPLGISPIGLSKLLGVNRQRIERLVKGTNGMSPDTANRLAKAFSTTPQYWMNLQLAWDLQELDQDAEMQKALEEIEPIALEEAA